MTIFRKLKEKLFAQSSNTHTFEAWARSANVPSTVATLPGINYPNNTYNLLPFNISSNTTGATFLEIYHKNIDILAKELSECIKGNKHPGFTKEYLNDAFQKFENLRPFYINMLDVFPNMSKF